MTVERMKLNDCEVTYMMMSDVKLVWSVNNIRGYEKCVVFCFLRYSPVAVHLRNCLSSVKFLLIIIIIIIVTIMMIS